MPAPVSRDKRVEAAISGYTVWDCLRFPMLHLTRVTLFREGSIVKQRTPSQVADTRTRTERWLAELDYSVEAIVREELVWGLAGRRDNSPGIGVAQMTKYTGSFFRWRIF